MRRPSATCGTWRLEVSAPPAPLRSDLVITPHPDDPERARVYDPMTGRRVELLFEAIEVAQHFDGRLDLEAISDAVQEGGGPWVSERVLEDLASDLGRMQLLEDADLRGRAPPAPQAQWEVERVPSGLPVEAHPDARFTCEGIGSCCRSGYLIPLDRLGADKIRRAARKREMDDDIVVVMPAGKRWTFALDNDPECPFLEPGSRCGIHGLASHPPACQTFPLAFTRLGARVLVTITHRCGCGTLARGRPLRSQGPSLARRLALGPVPRVVPNLALDDGARAGLEVPEAIVSSTLTPAQDACDRLQRAWAIVLDHAPRPTEPAPLHVASTDALSSVLSDLAEACVRDEDPVLTAALTGDDHPLGEGIRQDLLHAGLHQADADVGAEIDRFVRDHLYGVRFLHHGSVARGLFGLTLAAGDLLRVVPRGHLEVRVRIMLWEDVFVSPAFRGLLGPLGPLGSVLSSVWSAHALAASVLRS